MKPHQSCSNRFGTLTALLATCGLLTALPAVQASTQVQWIGGNAVGDFNYTDNWNWGGNLPSSGWGYELHFLSKNNSSQTSMYYSWGWASFDNIIYDSGFPSDPLNGGGNGIDFNQKIENDSYSLQTINIPTSGNQDGAGHIELNPVNGDLTLLQPVYDDHSSEYQIWGGNSKMLTVGSDLVGGASGKTGVILTIEQYSKVKLTAAQTWGDSSHGVNINQGEFWFDTGGSLASASVPIKVGLADGNVSKLWLSVLTGGVTLNNPITVNNQSSAAEKTVGGLNTSGTSTFNGSLTLNGQVNLSAGTGGTVVFAGLISGSGQNVVVNGYQLPLSGVIQMSATNTYSGNTYISGGTLQFNATGSANNSPTFYLGETSGSQTATLTLGATGGGQSFTNAINVRSGSTGAKTISSLATSGNSTLSCGVTLADNLMVSSASGGNLVLSGIIAGTGYGLTNNGSGTCTLSNANTYTGNTVISAGTLALSGSGSLASTNIVVAGGATFNVSGKSSVFALGSSQILTNSAVGALLNGTNQTGSGTVSLVYDGANPSFVITNGGMVLSASTTFKINNTGSTLAPGSYKIIAKATSGNVGLVVGTVPSSVTVVGGPSAGTPSLSIVNGELWLTVGGTSTWSYSGSSFTYNGLAQTPTIGLSGSTAAKTTNYVGTGATSYTSVNAPTNAGTYYVSNTVAADANYFGATNSQAFTIGQATSTATLAVNNSPVTYNGLGRTATVGITASNTAGTVTSILTGGQATQTNTGTYSVTATFVPNNPNYTTLTGLSAGSFTIGPAAPVITWGNPSDISYGTALSGTQLNATAGGVAGAFVYTPASGTVLGAGNAQTLSAQFTPTDTNNYSTPAPQTVSINVDPASLTITANSTSKAYGQNLAFAGTEFAASGLTNGDSVSSAALTSSGATNTATVGSYVIAVTNAAGGGLTNYTISYVAGSLTVNPLVAALSGTRAYDGTTNAAGASLTVTNVVNGDTVTLGGTGGLASADTGTNALTSFGTLSLDNGAGTNYTLAGATGAMIITNTPLVITANDDSKTYDGTAYTTNNGVTYVGFVNGETNTDLTGSLTFAGTSQGATTVGSYLITPSGYSSADYLISYVSGTLTVSQATPVINTPPTASTITYGQTLGDSTLSGGSATPSGGLFTFTASNTVPPVGTAEYSVTYAPTDTIDYTNATTTVSVTVNPAFTPSTNAYLAALVFSPSAGFAPAFTSNVLTGYNATNAYGDTPTVTVTNADATATNTLIVNGVSLGILTNEVASVPLTLGVGSTNVVQVQVVSQDLSVTNLYVVDVTLLPPPLSTNALLASLALTPAGTLSPAFDPGTTSYNATNTYVNNPVTVAATSADANATLQFNFNGGGYGTAVTNSLSVSGNTLVLPANTVAVRVVSQDLSQTNTYTVAVLLQPSQTVPNLTNSVSGGTNLVLSWPADHLGYRLLVQTNNLNKGVSGNTNDWGTVVGTASVTTTNIAILRAGVTNEYYKLVYP